MAIDKLVDSAQLESDLTSVADAIRAKTGGTADLAFPADFVSEIGSIETGGGDSEEDWRTPIDDVVFVDYDGTILHTYSADEFLALNTMPDNPSHSGLIAQGWNSTLQEAQNYVAENRTLCIGQNYTTTDGATKIYITVTEYMVGIKYQVAFYTTVKGSTTVDWGDGNVDAAPANAGSLNRMVHTYDASGDYVISITCTEGTVSLGNAASNSGAFIDTSYRETSSTAATIKEINFGDNIAKLNRYALADIENCEKISIPTTLLTYGEAANTGKSFAGCMSVKCVVFPPNSILHSTPTVPTLSNFRLAKFISFALSMSIDDIALANTASMSQFQKLRMFTVPPVSSYGGYVIGDAPCLEKWSIPGTYETFRAGSCREELWVKSIIIPETVTTISDYAMTNTFLMELHMRPTTPPVISNTRGMPLMGHLTIYVPYSADHSVLEAYQTATNWSSWASKIVEEAE